MANSTHRVEVVPIELLPHPNADSLSLVKVFGYQVVVRTEDWKDAKTAAYVPPDSVMPDAPEYSFLQGHLRIKARTLRGQISQGMLVPTPEGAAVGDDVAARLSITHYEPPVKYLMGDAETDPPIPGPHYDIDTWFKYADLIPDGTPVEVTEKLHGCLNRQVLVRMADDSRVPIKTLVNRNMVGAYVIGRDETGQLIPSRITAVHKNGPTDNWLKVRVQYSKAGGKGDKRSIICTPNHQFWTPNGYKRAGELSETDQVGTIRRFLNLTPVQKQVLLGKMLGDGNLSQLPSGASSLSFGHKEEHKDYLSWTMMFLGDLQVKLQKAQTSGYGTTMCRARTPASSAITEYLGSFIQNDIKTVPEWVVDDLGPIALAFWYMDDGSLGHSERQEDRVNFATCAFTHTDCEVLLRGLKKFGIDATIRLYDSYHRIHLTEENAEKFFLLIAPYIPPVLQYKLPERYRGGHAWMPEHHSSYKSQQIIQNVIGIETHNAKKQKVRYDITTETGNFFANDVLVHNSNTRVTFQEDRLWVASRANYRKPSPQSLYWQVIGFNPWIEQLARSLPNAVIYGETFGRVQDLRYGAKPGSPHQFRIFDVWHENKFMDAHQRHEFIGGGKITYDQPTNGVCINVVTQDWIPAHTPVLYIGPYNAETVRKFISGRSAIPGADHIREGIVIKPLTEQWNPTIGRLILKAVSPEYLEKA